MVSSGSPLSVRELPDFQQLEQHLLAEGWSSTAIPAAAVRFHTFQGTHDAPCRHLRCETGSVLLLLGLEAVRLPQREELFPRFLNLPLEARLALSYARSLRTVDWLLLSTRERVELYRLPEEHCELRAVTLRDWREQLQPLLASLARGRDQYLIAEAPHQPEAESLRGWLRHWSIQLGAALHEPAALAEHILWKWIVALQLARRRNEEFDGWGLGLRSAESSGKRIPTVAYDAASATDDLVRRLASFDEAVVSGLFLGDVDDQLARLHRLDETALADRLRAELLMHSQNRFEPETVAWLFTNLDREQEGWRREVRGVEPIRRRLHLEGWQVLRPLVCEVDRFGLTAALRDLETLAFHLQGLRDARGAAPLEPPVSQLDLFRANPVGVAEGSLVDPLNYLFGEAFRVRGVPEEEQFGVALSLLLKSFSLAARLGWPLGAVDTLDLIFTDAD